MASKTICLECKSYSTIDKNNQCFRCETDNILSVGSAFRLPRKTEVKKWRKIKELYYIQCAIPRNEPGNRQYLMGFRNNAGWLSKEAKTLPKSLKERAIIQSIKKSSLARFHAIITSS